jgi:hypothetical protein
MSSSAPSGPLAWFAGRRLAVKFGALLAVVVLAFGALLASTLTSNETVRSTSATRSAVADAEALVLQLDTRASELKVDGLKALVGPDPRAQLADIEEDTATADGLLEDLAAVPLTGDAATAVAGLEGAFATYTAAIRAFTEGAAADQAGARLRYQEIQAANDLSDAAVSQAKDVLDAASTAADVEVGAAIDRATRQGLLTAAAVETTPDPPVAGPPDRAGAGRTGRHGHR